MGFSDEKNRLIKIGDFDPNYTTTLHKYENSQKFILSLVSPDKYPSSEDILKTLSILVITTPLRPSIEENICCVFRGKTPLVSNISGAA